MPWLPEHFTARFLADQRSSRGRELEAVPFFEGILSGERRALSASFAGIPEIHDPIRGRVKGARAFDTFVDNLRSELRRRDAVVTPVDLILTPTRTVEEVTLTQDIDGRVVHLPVAIVADRSEAGLLELRVYFSTWPLTGGHANRPPLLQPDGSVRESGAIGDYQRALADGDVEAVVATFEPEATVREPAGEPYVHRGEADLRALYTLFFSNGGGIPLEHCTATDDGRACALEYNVTQWGRTELPPEAGIAVYVRGATGRLAAARIYDDSNPPLKIAEA